MVIAASRRFMREWKEQLASDFEQDALEKFDLAMRGWNLEAENLVSLQGQLESLQEQVDGLVELRLDKTKFKANETQRFSGENRKMILQIMKHFPGDKREGLVDDINAVLGGLGKFKF